MHIDVQRCRCIEYSVLVRGAHPDVSGGSGVLGSVALLYALKGLQRWCVQCPSERITGMHHPLRNLPSMGTPTYYRRFIQNTLRTLGVFFPLPRQGGPFTFGRCSVVVLLSPSGIGTTTIQHIALFDQLIIYFKHTSLFVPVYAKHLLVNRTPEAPQ